MKSQKYPFLHHVALSDLLSAAFFFSSWVCLQRQRGMAQRNRDMGWAKGCWKMMSGFCSRATWKSENGNTETEKSQPSPFFFSWQLCLSKQHEEHHDVCLPVGQLFTLTDALLCSSGTWLLAQHFSAETVSANSINQALLGLCITHLYANRLAHITYEFKMITFTCCCTTDGFKRNLVVVCIFNDD